MDLATQHHLLGVVRREASCNKLRGGGTGALDSSLGKPCYKGELRSGDVIRGTNGVKGRLKARMYTSRMCSHTKEMIQKGGDW